ncbi:MAG TPA: hypothetical protein VJ111_05910 [Chitinophagaceae bacterium]|nr:hypothetical protein [Chitinophagaceae bacterium]
MIYKSLSTTTKPATYLFSVCSIITSEEEYTLMRQSFEACGFTDDCEYIIADNTKSNNFDAYRAISRFIRESQGKYLIIVHQDVRCIDNKSRLEKCLNDLSHMDDKWAICGNAGAIGYHQFVHHINNAGRIIINANLPARVSSLDENLLIINKATSITISPDLTGFHLYGTDLCIIADFLGYNCYVIPFMVKHLSLGNLKELSKNVTRFIDQYGKKIRSRYVETTCTKFYLSNSVFKNKLCNSSFIFFFIKAGQRIKLFSKRLSKPSLHKKTIVPE